MPKRPPKPANLDRAPRFKRRNTTKPSPENAQDPLAPFRDFGLGMVQWARESDRGAALVGAAAIESTLLASIQSVMHKDRDVMKTMFGPGRPLGSFNSKIQLGFLLGLYNKNILRELLVMRTIRNSFAHQVMTVQFDQSDIIALCDKLKLVEKHTVDTDMLRKDTNGLIAKERGVYFLYPVDNCEWAIKNPRNRYYYSIMVMHHYVVDAAINPKALRIPAY